MAFKAAFGEEAEIVGTVICGDGYFAENMDQAGDKILKMIADFKPDAVIAGPAFNAGRYGTACGAMAGCDQKTRDTLLQECILGAV